MAEFKAWELLKLAQGRRRDAGEEIWGILGDASGNPNVAGQTGKSWVRFPSGSDDSGVQQYYPPIPIWDGIGAAFLKKGGRRVWVGLDPMGIPEIKRGDRQDLSQVGITGAVTNPLTTAGKTPNPANPFLGLLSDAVATTHSPTTKVMVYPLWYDTGTEIKYYPGTETEADKVDLASFIPIAGEYCYVVLWLDTATNALETPTASTPATITSTFGNADRIAALEECYAAKPNTNCIPIMAYYLANAQTSIVQSKKHIDLRQMINMPSTGGGSTPPFTDTTAIVKGSADATKLLRFEVDGFTTGTTRVATFQNADGTVAYLSDIPAAGITQLTGDVTAGPGSGSQVATLANSGVSAGQYSGPLITVDVKGRTTSAIGGIGIRAYVDYLATTFSPAFTYNNGSSGVGATLTGNSNGALSVDGSTVTVGQRLLVIVGGVGAAENGIYVVTQVGAALTSPYILTRADDANTSVSLRNSIVFITSGVVNTRKTYYNTNTSAITIGTTNVTYLLGVEWSPPIRIESGGTGASTQTAGFDSLSPLSARGDLVVYNISTFHNVRLPAGTNGFPLVPDSSLDVGLKYSSTVTLAQINDTNGNEQIKFVTTASAINEVTHTNAATGNAPEMAATGGDTNIDLKLSSKGTGAIVSNTTVKSDTDNTDDLGTSAVKWREAFTNLLTLEERTAPSTPASGDASVYAKVVGSIAQLFFVNDSGNHKQATPSYAVLSDSKTAATNGGTSASTTWNARDLNTEVSDADGIVSISSNKFTPVAGVYFILAWSAVVGQGAGNTGARERLFNVTGTATVVEGENLFLVANQGDLAFVAGVFTANGTDEYRMDTYTSVGRTTTGLGVQMNNGSPELYTRVILVKIGA